MSPFAERLCASICGRRTPAVVGIDPRWEDLPPELKDPAIARHGPSLVAVAASYREFSERLIDAVADLVPAVKFQAAFFEAAGPAGMAALADALLEAKRAGLIAILDGKRNDIGSTAAAYAQAYLSATSVAGPAERAWAADALTVNAYLGAEGLDPFVAAAAGHGTGIFVLVRTSNPGAGEIQELTQDGTAVFERMADLVEARSRASTGGSRFGPVGAVVGATVPAQLAELRRRMPSAILLVPGYGAQGGTASDTSGAFAPDGLGAIVNSSRGVALAYKRYRDMSWVDAARAATKDMITDLAAHTPAGKLR